VVLAQSEGKRRVCRENEVCVALSPILYNRNVDGRSAGDFKHVVVQNHLKIFAVKNGPIFSPSLST
jgi:hypothetical protein